MNELPIMLLAAGLGGLVQSAAGFGSALVAIPLLMQVVEPRTATPIQALLSLVVSVVVLRRNWKSLDFIHARSLVLASAPGIPIGVYFLTTLPARWIHAALGVLLIGYSTWALFFDRRPPENPAGGASAAVPDADSAGDGATTPATWITGFCSGMLGGAYNTSGPPLVLYASLSRWPPAKFKSILSAYFVCEGVMLIIYFSISGLITGEVLSYFTWLLPAMIAGIVTGFALEKRIPRARFAKIVLILLFVLGIRMLTR